MLVAVPISSPSISAGVTSIALSPSPATAIPLPTDPLPSALNGTPTASVSTSSRASMSSTMETTTASSQVVISTPSLTISSVGTPSASAVVTSPTPIATTTPGVTRRAESSIRAVVSGAAPASVSAEPWIDRCADRYIARNDTLLSTTNFARLTMDVQFAGRDMYDACGLTQNIAQLFTTLSASNTQTEESFWFITGVSDGPGVYVRNISVVTVASANRNLMAFQAPNTTISASSGPSYAALPSPEALLQLFNGSVIMNVTVYVDAQSMVLLRGSYVDLIRSQNLVQLFFSNNVTQVEWAGFARAPENLDLDVVMPSLSNMPDIPTITPGAVSSFVVLGTAVTGLGAFIVLESVLTGMTAATTAASSVFTSV